MAVARFLLVATDWSAASSLKVILSPNTLPWAAAVESLARNASRSGGQEQGIRTVACPLDPSQLPRCLALALVLRVTPNDGTRAALMARRESVVGGAVVPVVGAACASAVMRRMMDMMNCMAAVCVVEPSFNVQGVAFV